MRTPPKNVDKVALSPAHRIGNHRNLVSAMDEGNDTDIATEEPSSGSSDDSLVFESYTYTYKGALAIRISGCFIFTLTLVLYAILVWLAAKRRKRLNAQVEEELQVVPTFQSFGGSSMSVTTPSQTQGEPSAGAAAASTSPKTIKPQRKKKSRLHGITKALQGLQINASPWGVIVPTFNSSPAPPPPPPPQETDYHKPKHAKTAYHHPRSNLDAIEETTRTDCSQTETTRDKDRPELNNDNNNNNSRRQESLPQQQQQQQGSARKNKRAPKREASPSKKSPSSERTLLSAAPTFAGQWGVLFMPSPR